MRKLDIGQLLQLLGNAGVIVGILLLVYELNQNRQMMQAQTRNAISETVVNLLALTASTPELAEMQAKRGAGESLDAVDQARFMSLEGAYWRYRENVHYQYRNGLYEDSEYVAQREAWIRQINTEEDSRAMYCLRRRSMSDAFTAEIDGLLDRPC